jgi:hypothetical protein
MNLSVKLEIGIAEMSNEERLDFLTMELEVWKVPYL